MTDDKWGVGGHKERKIARKPTIRRGVASDFANLSPIFDSLSKASSDMCDARKLSMTNRSDVLLIVGKSREPHVSDEAFPAC